MLLELKNPVNGLSHHLRSHRSLAALASSIGSCPTMILARVELVTDRLDRGQRLL
jgi:hypothetical protein